MQLYVRAGHKQAAATRDRSGTKRWKGRLQFISPCGDWTDGQGDLSARTMEFETLDCGVLAGLAARERKSVAGFYLGRPRAMRGGPLSCYTVVVSRSRRAASETRGTRSTKHTRCLATPQWRRGMPVWIMWFKAGLIRRCWVRVGTAHPRKK